MVRDKDMEYSNGIMDRFFREDGRMEWRMVLESGNLLKETIIKETGFKIGNMVRGYFDIV